MQTSVCLEETQRRRDDAGTTKKHAAFRAGRRGGTSGARRVRRRAAGLDGAERKLAQLDPALGVWQCDAPGLPALRQCIRLAESSEAVFLLLVRPGTYEAVWQFVQAAGICVMSWPAPQEVFRQTLRNLLLLKKSLRAMQEKTDQLQSQLQDMKRIQKAKSLLMNQLGMSEADAHRWIEKAAMDRCVKKREIAETIIRMYAL